MKQIVKLILDQTEFPKKSRNTYKKIGLQTLVFENLTFKNRKGWIQSSLFWTDVAADPYFHERTLSIRKIEKDYLPEYVLFRDIFTGSPQNTIQFLKKIDAACIEATSAPFPDFLFNYTFSPDMGPYGDLLQAIINKKQIIQPSLLLTSVLDIGLSVAQKNKSMENYRTLSKNDMVFLANFVCFINNHKVYLDFIMKHLDSSIAMLYIIEVFKPKHALHHLDWDEKLIRNCFDNAIKEMQIYDLDPKIAEELYFSGQQITRKNILDARKATS